MRTSETMVLAVVVCSGLIADVARGKIYNWITLPAIGIGLALNAVLYGLPGLKSSAIGLGVGFGVFLAVYLFLGGFGGGDVKFMGAIGAITGYPFIVWVMVYSILVGGIMAIAVIVWKRKFLSTMKNVFWYFLSRIVPGLAKTHLDPTEQDKVPFGVAIALGTIWALVMDRFVGTGIPF